MKKLVKHPRRLFGVAITYLILLLVAFVFLFPILWLVLASFASKAAKL